MQVADAILLKKTDYVIYKLENLFYRPPPQIVLLALPFQSYKVYVLQKFQPLSLYENTQFFVHVILSRFY